MGPKIRIVVSDTGEILVWTEGMTDGEWNVYNHELSIQIAHQVIAGQTKRLPLSPP